MLGGGEIVDKLTKDGLVAVVYFAIVLVLILVIVFYVMKTYKKVGAKAERLCAGTTVGGANLSAGSASAANTTGWSTFTGANQGEGAQVDYVQNVTCKASTGQLPSAERLVSEREPPVIYDVYDEISAINDSLKTSYDDVLANFALQANDLSGTAPGAGAPERFY